MKLTNKLNLPLALVRACTNDTYRRGDADFTVTELTSPPRVRALMLTHADELTEDVSDVLYRLCGSIGHGIIERAGDNSENEDIIERRFKAAVTVDGKEYTVSGQADLVRDNANAPFDIWDWKFSSIYQFKNGPKPEYIAQLNILRLLAKRDAKLEARGLYSAPIYRDWSARQSKTTPAYPSTQVQVFSVERWPDCQTIGYICERIQLHLAARSGNLPECSPEERWSKGATYRVVKKGGTRAAKNGIHALRQFAESHQKQLGDDYVVQKKEAESIRCESYCPVADFCQQWQSIKPQEDELL